MVPPDFTALALAPVDELPLLLLPHAPSVSAATLTNAVATENRLFRPINAPIVPPLEWLFDPVRASVTKR